MVWAWQQWLSPRPLRRTVNSHLKTLTAADMARFEIIEEDNGRWKVREVHFIDHPAVKAGLSGPPLHIHLKQDEYFEVDSGILAAEIDGKEYTLTKGQGKLGIFRGSRHRFWSHPSSTEDLIFHGVADPCKDEDNILDINFLRNLVGYLTDCAEAGLTMSVWQHILFCHHASTLSCPPFLNWMPIPLLRVVHYVLATWIAKGFLGYKPFYPEYTAKPRSE